MAVKLQHVFEAIKEERQQQDTLPQEEGYDLSIDAEAGRIKALAMCIVDGLDDLVDGLTESEALVHMLEIATIACRCHQNNGLVREDVDGELAKS